MALPVPQAVLKLPERSLRKYKCSQPFLVFASSAQLCTTIVSFEPRDAVLSGGCAASGL